MSGNVDIRQVDLGFRVMGRIAAIPFEEGAHVPANAILAGLDDAPYEDAAATALSQVASSAGRLFSACTAHKLHGAAQGLSRARRARQQGQPI